MRRYELRMELERCVGLLDLIDTSLGKAEVKGGEKSGEEGDED